MKEIKKVEVIGLGAIGAAYSSKIFDYDPSIITVIADKERIQRYREKGVKVNGKEYRFKYAAPEDTTVAADLILVAVKHHHLPRAIEQMRSSVGEDTIILSLMNGITSEVIMGRELGMDRMLYGVCVGIDAQRTGTDIRFSTSGKILFGEKKNETLSQKVRVVKDLFEKTGIPHEVPQDMMRAMWWKFMVNVGVNQVSAVLRAPYGVFQSVGDAYAMMEDAMKEVIELSQKEGMGLKEEDIHEFKRILGTLSSDGKTSMLQDIEAGRKTEVEMFAGVVSELGKKHRVNTPVNDFLYKVIRILEQMKNY